MTPVYVTFFKDGYWYCVDLYRRSVDCAEPPNRFMRGKASEVFPYLLAFTSSGLLGGAEIWTN